MRYGLSDLKLISHHASKNFKSQRTLYSFPACSTPRIVWAEKRTYMP